MGSIADFERDISGQLEALSGFVPPEAPDRIDGAMFCGSGDSLASSMLAEAFSGYRVRASDPRELASNPDIIRDRTVYIVSVSGRTVSNIRVAEAAGRSVAITAEPDSALARACDDIVPLVFESSDSTTAGSISFLNSALVCISLVHPVTVSGQAGIFDDARAAAAGTTVSGRPYVLGDLYTYPVAMYAAAKFYEILGTAAVYERIEQFCHMGLFGTRPGDTAIIMERPSDSRLDSALDGAGLNVVRSGGRYGDRVSEFLFYAFFAQLLPLRIAKSEGRAECHFMVSSGCKQASDELIY